ncbi:MAG: hemolysin family protein [Defluviitaleaceae bacterium]|nr:hemolysin family protein [Defluviitaleaceae bacterium]
MIQILINIGILGALILLSGVFSATEIALSSVNRTKLKMKAESGDKKAKRLLVTLENPTGFFAVTQLYITFIALFSGAYAASAFTDPIIEWVMRFELPVSAAIAEPVVFVLVTVALTYFSLVFGELVPKHIALRNSTTVALATIGFFNVLSKIVLPFVNLLSVSANLLLKLLGIKDDGHEDEVTKDDLRMMLQSGSEHGSIAESEHNILSNVLELDDKTVKDVCVHRIDVVGIPVDADFNEILDVLVNEQYSRIPVYEESVDRIIGILHMKDVMKYMVENPDTTGFDIKHLLREPYFASSFKKTNELLIEMQKKRVYMAIVVDEYGGVMGIVTIEDLVEEIVGSILDEHDTDEPSDILSTDDNVFVIQGTTDCEKVKNYFGTDLPVDEYDTLSGFLIGQLKRIPSEDEKPEIRYGNLLFKVESVQEKRIAKVVVSVISDDISEEENDELGMDI